MSEQQSSYRSIFKATSLFGGVQVFNILISIIKTKFVSYLLGPAGYGIMSLFSSAIETITYLTNLGLSSSAVRNISEANDTGDTDRIRRVVTVFRRWLWFTGILGAVITLVLSPWLSQWSFGNKDFTLSFALLSVTLLLSALSSGQSTLLQGMRRINFMAKSSVIGSTLGLFISLPLYYFFKIDGIVPTFILSSILGLVLTYYFSNKLQIKSVEMPMKQSFFEGMNMVKLGILITVSGFLSTLSNYLINTYISSRTGQADVGLFQAGNTLVYKYVGMVFTAMVADFYPRLAGVNQDNLKVKEVVNQQTEIALLILAPILILLISTTPLVIALFYTNKFLPVVVFVQWVALGTMLRAVAWAMGFIVLAKGDSKLYFYKEVVSIAILLSCNVGGYYFWGLEGLGISFVVGQALVFIYVYAIVRIKYEFTFNKPFYKIFSIQLGLCTMAFLLAYIFGFPVAYISGSVIFLITAWISFREIDKRMNVMEIIRTQITKRKNK